MDIQQHATEAAITKVASVATYGGASTAVYFGLSPGEWQAVGVIGGLIFAAIGLGVTVYFKQQHLELAREQRRADRDA